MKPDSPQELLVSAYKRLRKHNWGSFVDALADPIRGRLIRGLARRMETGTAPVCVENPPNLPGKQTLQRYHARPAFQGLDRKRLAAGEREDD